MCECVLVVRSDLSGNEISALEGESLRGLRRLHDLVLARNRLRRLPAAAFSHTPDLQVLWDTTLSYTVLINALYQRVSCPFDEFCQKLSTTVKTGLRCEVFVDRM